MMSSRALFPAGFWAMCLCVATVACAAAPAAALDEARAAFRPTAFEDVDYVDGSTAFAAATPGCLYVSSNGGRSWSLRPMGNNDWLTALDFVSASHGWVLGVYNEGVPARIWHTKDGGRHWVLQTNPTSCDVLIDVAFASTSVGLIVGRYGTILRTVDGGRHWTQVASGTTAGLSAVDFATSSVAYAVGGGGRILKSTNGGATWQSLGGGKGRDLRDVCFTSSRRGWIVGADGLVLRTTNGGVTWSKQATGTKKALAGVDFVDGSRGWAVGGGGVVLRTANGGATWTRQSSGTTAFLHAVDFVSAAKGCAVGERMRPPGSDPYAVGVIRFTSNGGRLWTKAF